MIAIALVLALGLCAQDSALKPGLGAAERLPILPRSLQDATELRIYELERLSGHAQLQAVLDGFSSASNAHSADSALTRFSQLERLRSNAEQTTLYLLSTIRDLIQPPLAQDLQGLCHLDRGRLALLGTLQQHAWLSRFLLAADQFEGLILLEAKIYKYDPSLVLGLDELGTGSVLSEATTAKLLSDFDAAGVEIITAPSIQSFAFQKAMLSVLSQTAYVKDYELKVLPGLSTEIADPVIDTINSGLLLNFRGVPLADQQLGIFVDLELSELALPIPSAEFVIGAGQHKVTVQLPEVTRFRVEGHFNVHPGETLLLSSASPTGDSKVIVLLRTTRVSEPDTESTRDR